MAEYIEREKAIEEIDIWLDSVGSIIVGKGLSSYGELIGCIQDVPATDVAEVKHGKWVDLSETDILFENTYECDNCNTTFVFEISPKECNCNYCPNCGARMDGEEE